MTRTPGAATHGTAQASRPYWRPDTLPASTAHVVAADVTIIWDRSRIRVAAGTLVHVEPGSALWDAYGGEDGLRPVHGGQARP